MAEGVEHHVCRIACLYIRNIFFFWRDIDFYVSRENLSDQLPSDATTPERDDPLPVPINHPCHVVLVMGHPFLE